MQRIPIRSFAPKSNTNTLSLSFMMNLNNMWRIARTRNREIDNRMIIDMTRDCMLEEIKELT